MERRGDKKRKRISLSTTQVIVLSFVLTILVGTTLLELPFATESGQRASVETALFTSVSATCVTGLVAEDTATYWSNFGEAVILSMIQIGGLGFMTVAMMLSLVLRRVITPRARQVAADSLSLTSTGGIVRLVRRILYTTGIIELGGAILLSFRMIPIFGVPRGIWCSLFHSISAFCNAGFDLMGDYSGPYSSMTCFEGDWLINLVLMCLILAGGIGFVVWEELSELFRRQKPLSVYSRLVLVISAILVFGGAAVILVSEWSNPETLGSLPVNRKILASLFQSVTCRTAGMNTVDLSAMHEGTLVLMCALMFVGGASGSTAGGVKMGTVGLVFLAAVNTLRGRQKVVVFRRSVSGANVLRALTITVIQFTLTMTGCGILLAYGVALMPALVEAFSAAATVGLSLSLTPGLSLVPHVILMTMMFFGRVGILTVTYSIMFRFSRSSEVMDRPEAKMLIG